MVPFDKANASDTEASFYLYLSVSNGFVSTQNYDKRDDFDIVKSRDASGGGGESMNLPSNCRSYPRDRGDRATSFGWGMLI